jgi:predicted cupin superfamily sugar epimerase
MLSAVGIKPRESGFRDLVQNHKNLTSNKIIKLYAGKKVSVHACSINGEVTIGFKLREDFLCGMEVTQ